jgi:DNA-binding beta-propeller fold protein YncE
VGTRLSLLLASLLVISSAAASAAGATTWSLANGWATSPDGTTPPSNPSGPWGIGYGKGSYAHDPALSSFRLAPSADWANGVPGGQTSAQGWQDTSGGDYPYIAKNTTASDAFGGIWPPGAVEGHPAPDGSTEDRPVIEWISPITGTVSVSASFIGMNYCSAGLDYSVDVKPHGGSLTHVVGGYFPALGTGTYSNPSVSVSAGDTYYFSVGDGGTGSFQCDSTQFSITISSNAGPAGSTLAWHNNITGSGAQTLSKPEGVSLNTSSLEPPTGVIITDSGNNRVETSDPFGTTLTTFDGVSLSDPRQAIFNANNFVVSDTNHGRVEQIQSGTNTDAGPFGMSNGQNVSYGFPRGIAQSQDNTRIAVADAGSSAVYVFDSGGNQVFHLTGIGSSAGALNAPEGVAFDGSYNLWVADTQNHRLVEFSGADGSVLKTISPSSSFYPTGLAVDPHSGNIWVAAWGNGNVVELGPGGTVLQTVTRANGSSDSLNGPVTLAFDPNSGDLYVADTSNNRIVHYTGAGQGPVVHTDGIFSNSSTDLGVQGRVNPEGLASTYYVQYGTGSDPSSLNQYQPAQPQSLADGTNTPYTDTTDHTVQVHLSGLTAGQNYCYRFVAFNAMGAGYGAIKCENSVAAPTVTTDGVISTSNTDLDIKGTINPNQTPNLKYYLEMGLDKTHFTMFKPVAPPGQNVGFSDSSNHDFTADFTGLRQGTQYCFQIVATNGSASYPGGVLCHSTVGPPVVHTDGVYYQDVNDMGIQGRINPTGTPNLTFYVRYGLDSTHLTSQFTPTSATVDGTSQSGNHLNASDFTDHTVQVRVQGLKAGTQYCFQLVATNGPETVASSEVVCHATTGSPVPLVTTSTPSCSKQQCDWTETTATLSGSVNPDGAPASWYFQMTRCPGFDYSSCPSAFHNTTNVPASPQPLGENGFSPHIVTTTATGLQPGTTYYYRLVATNTNTGHSAYDTHIQSVTTSQLVISARYFDGQGVAHQFSTGDTPTFDPSGGISWSFDCSLLGQPGGNGITSCDAYYTDYSFKNGWHSALPGNSYPYLGAVCTDSKACPYTITINARDSYGQTAQAIYHYSVNPPPPPAVQKKENNGANNTINHTVQPQPGCAFWDVICNAKQLGQKVGGAIQAGWNAVGDWVSEKVRAAVAAAKSFMDGFGSNLAVLAKTAKDFLGAIFTQLTFTIGGHTSPVPFSFGFDQDGNRYIAAAAGYHLEPGTVGNIIGAGAGNIIGAGAGNARDLARDGRSASQTNNSQAYLAASGERVQDIAVSNLTGKLAGIIGAGAGNLNIFAQIIGAGAGNFVAGLCAFFQHAIIGAGSGNIIGAGAGNIIGAGAGNIIGAGAGNFNSSKEPKIIGAGAGNLGHPKLEIVGAGAANLIGVGNGNIVGGSGGGHARDAGSARDAASGSVFYGASPLSFTELAGTTVRSRILIVALKGRRPQGHPVILAAGGTTFLVTGKGTVWLTYTRAGNRLLLAVGAHNSAAVKKHRSLEKVKYTVINTFKPLHGRAKTYTHSYTESPTGA